MGYLIWYNMEKPHRGIGNLSPMRYYLDNFLPPDQSNMLWTLTQSVLRQIKLLPKAFWLPHNFGYRTAATSVFVGL
jgi:hypothetical protein